MQADLNWHGHGPWEAWFAWYPLLINGQSVWLRTVERRYQYRHHGDAVERRWIYQLQPSSRHA